MRSEATKRDIYFSDSLYSSLTSESQLVVLESLLIQGSEPDAHDPRVGRNASTPLMACAAGRSQPRTREACMTCARRLIEALPEAGLSAKNSQGVTALMVAAGNADMSLAKLLIKKGADVDGKDAKGKTAQSYAYNGVGGR